MNLAVTLMRQGRDAEAETQLRQALELDPLSAESWANLAVLLSGCSRFEEGVAAIERAVMLAPTRFDLVSELGRQLLAQGRAAEACAAFSRVAEIAPNDPRPHLAYLMSLNYIDERSPEEVATAHRKFGEWFGSAGSPLPRFTNTPDPSRPLRVGLVSPDFRAHSCASFIASMLRWLPRDECEPWCYSQVTDGDSVSDQFRALAAGWRTTAKRSGAEIARDCREDGIDVLIDLAGLTYGSRIDVFIHHGAPVQMTYLGYPNTTGIKQIGWRIVDAVTDPPGSEHLLIERPARVESCFLCYSPKGLINQRAPIARRPGGPFTFAACPNIAKISPAVIAAWCEMLRRVPGSRLLVKSEPLSDAGTWARYERMFAESGAPAGSVERLPYAPSFDAHLESYRGIDLILDTYPYNGTTTTCEQLFLGVPVLTWAGRSHVARVGASLLSTAGHPELIGWTREEFVARAVELAGHPAQLTAIRARLHEDVLRSPLCDGQSFGRRLARVIRTAWTEWCRSSFAAAPAA